MRDGDKATMLKEVKQILHRIDHANAHMKKTTVTFLKASQKTAKVRRKRKNPKRERKEVPTCVGSRTTIMHGVSAQKNYFNEFLWQIVHRDPSKQKIQE
jgi:hypothetical protein